MELAPERVPCRIIIRVQPLRRGGCGKVLLVEIKRRTERAETTVLTAILRGNNAVDALMPTRR